MKEYLEKIETVLQRYTEVMRILSDPDVIHNRERFLEYSRERAQLEELQSLYDNYRRAMKEYEENQELLQSEDSEIAALANEEIPSLEKRLKEDERALLVGILPPDPAAKNSAIVEIRAGTGGEEAALFAGSLFRMYNRYSDIRHWKTEILDSNPTDLGGFKEIVFKIKGKGAYGALKYEGGVHRVQRVPETRSERKDPYLFRFCGSLARNHRGYGDRYFSRGYQDRCLSRFGGGGPTCQSHGVRGADHPPSDRHRRYLSE